MKLDADGMPENAMFYLDIRNGKAYFRGDIYAEDGYFRGEVHATDGEFTGTVHATSGEFTGIVHATGGDFTGTVKATDFLAKDGTSMMTNGKFNSRYLDLGNIQIDGDTGDITMTGDINMGSASNITMGGDITLGGNITLGGTISWSTANSPTLVLYAQSALTKPTRTYASYPASSASGWHKTMGTADKFASYTYDGGSTWTDAVKLVGDDGQDGENGKNGRDGSDADVTFANIKAALQKAASTESTFITADEMGAPNIYGGNIYGANIYAGDGSGSFAHMDGDSLRLYCGGVFQPKVKIDIGYQGLQPRIDLGAGDGWSNQIFSFIKNQTQGIIQYSGSVGSYSMLVFNEDGSIMPIGPTHMRGIWDFSNATVKGVYATFA